MKNALIEETFFGFEAHGIISFSLTMDYGDGGHQGFGGWDLRWKGYGIPLIERILIVVGVDSWEDLKGKHVRVKLNDAVNKKIIAIGHITKDKWLDVEEFGNRKEV